MNKKYLIKKSKICFLLAFTLIFSALVLITNSASAATPPMVNLQLYLEDDAGKAVTGNISLTIRLFDGEFSNNVLYTNDVTDRYISVTNGYLNYYIKNLYGIDFSKEIWVEVSIDGTQLPNRIKFASVPYAFYADRAATADNVDTALYAKAVAPNAISSQHIQNNAVTNTHINPNTILPGNIKTDENFDWTGTHTLQNTNAQLQVNSNTYAINVIKGTVKLITLESDSIVATYILTTDIISNKVNTKNIQTDTVTLNKYSVLAKDDELLINYNNDATNSGLSYKNGILNYIEAPQISTFGNNSIINKYYVDSLISNSYTSFGMLGQRVDTMFYKIDTVRYNLEELTRDLAPNVLTKWNGSKLLNSNILEQENRILYRNNILFGTRDSLALVNKLYVDTYVGNYVTTAIEDAKLHVSDGIYASMSNNAIPKWDGGKFINSNILEDKDTVKIGDAKFIVEASIPTTSLKNVNHLEAVSLWTNNIVTQGIATSSAEYTNLNTATMLPNTFSSYTLTPKGYVDKLGDSLVYRISNDSIDGTRLKAGTVLDAHIANLSGAKLFRHSITGGASGQIAFNTIFGDNITQLSIRDTHIVPNAITSEHIRSGSILENHIADGLITSSKIAPNSIDNTHLIDGGVYTEDLHDEIITNEKISDNAVTNEKIRDNEIEGAKLRDYDITDIKIRDQNITTAKLRDGAVTNTKLDVNDIRYNTTNMEENRYMPSDVAPQTLTTKSYVDNLIDEVYASTIDGNRIVDNSITSNKIKLGEIKTENLAEGAVNDIKIASDAVRNQHLRVSRIEYKGNSELPNKMPASPSDSTLTTVAYVDNKIASFNSISNNSVSQPALSVSNTAPAGGIALQVNRGNVALSVTNIENHTGTLPSGYAIYNLHGYPATSDNTVVIYLPTPAVSGQVIYVSNNSFATYIPWYGSTAVGPSITIDAVATFIAIPNYKDSQNLTWRRVRG